VAGAALIDRGGGPWATPAESRPQVVSELSLPRKRLVERLAVGVEQQVHGAGIGL